MKKKQIGNYGNRGCSKIQHLADNLILTHFHNAHHHPSNRKQWPDLRVLNLIKKRTLKNMVEETRELYEKKEKYHWLKLNAG